MTITEIDCQEFVKALDLASGCLQTHEILPILSHICFEYESFYAYDDRAATIVSMRTGLHCAVNGSKLISMLKPLSGTLRLEQYKDTVLIDVFNRETGSKYGASLATLGNDEFIYRAPKDTGHDSVTFELTDEMLSALITACDSVSKNPMEIDWSGVNIILKSGENNAVVFCACDNMTLVTMSFPDITIDTLHNGTQNPVIIPTSTIQQLKRVRAAQKNKDVLRKRRLTIGDSWVSVVFDTHPDLPRVPKTTVISRLIVSQQPRDFLAIRDGYLDRAGEWIKLPSAEFSTSLGRAVSASKGDPLAVFRIAVENDRLYMQVDNSVAQVDDTHIIDADCNKQAVTVNPVHVARYADQAEDFAIDHDRAFCMRKGRSYFIIGGVSAE